MVPGLKQISSLLGWSYFICWPVLLNRKLRSVEGISFDFLYLNILGFLCYSVSVSLLYFSPLVRGQYSERNTPEGYPNPKMPLVKSNDIAFSLQGLLLTLVIFFQVYWWNYKRSKHQAVSRGAKVVLTVAVMIISFMAITIHWTESKVIGVEGEEAHRLSSFSSWQWLDFALILGNIKVFMSTAKYIPQLLWNRSRKSTKGWSIHSIMLDVIGGICCLSQLVLDGVLNNDLAGMFHNPSKPALAIVTLFFDSLFLIQHYILYPETHEHFPEKM